MAVVVDEVRISEAPWNGSSGRFTDDQWQSSCALDRKSCGGKWDKAPAKTRCALPYKEPGGEVSRAGTHAAAARIGQVTDTCDEATKSAKSKLRAAYKALGEEPPASLGDKSKSDDGEFDELAREFGVTPGVARHGESGLRWDTNLELLIREDEAPPAGYLGTLHGHFCVFNRWTKINSLFEGRFMERIAPGACKKTFTENRKGMRVLLNHGRDPQFGMKPIGPIRDLEEDDVGGRYEVPILDNSLNRDLLPGLKENLYGASFRFQVIREEVNTEPKRSPHNPEGIEERTITEMKIREFGPVTFPAYEDATAGVRSLNDWWLDLDLEMFARAHPDCYPERLAALLNHLRAESPAVLLNRSEEPSEEAAEQNTEESRETPEAPEAPEAPEDAPPSRAPDAPASSPTRSTHLSGAARRALRTSRSEERPWKL